MTATQRQEVTDEIAAEFDLPKVPVQDIKKSDAAQAWLTSPPPKDGTTIIAIGRLKYEDEFSVTFEPFVLAVRWERDQSNYEGWHYRRDGMTVASTLDDEVIIDYWLPYPPEGHENNGGGQ